MIDDGRGLVLLGLLGLGGIAAARGSRGVVRSSRRPKGTTRPPFLVQVGNREPVEVEAPQLVLTMIGEPILVKGPNDEGNWPILAEAMITGDHWIPPRLRRGQGAAPSVDPSADVFGAVGTPQNLLYLRAPDGYGIRILLTNRQEDWTSGYKASQWGDRVFPWVEIHPKWVKVPNWRARRETDSPTYLLLHLQGARWTGDADQAGGVRFVVAEETS